MTGIADLAFTPFSVGFVGGLITGIFPAHSRWQKLGLGIWFAGWVLAYTVVIAFHAERPLEAVPTALGIAGIWGMIPFLLTFSLGKFITNRLHVFKAKRDI